MGFCLKILCFLKLVSVPVLLCNNSINILELFQLWKKLDCDEIQLNDESEALVVLIERKIWTALLQKEVVVSFKVCLLRLVGLFVIFFNQFFLSCSYYYYILIYSLECVYYVPAIRPFTHLALWHSIRAVAAS
jgi:hypothetical protein